MQRPDAATKAATRIAAKAYEALDAARKIRDDPEAAIERIGREEPELGCLSEDFNRAEDFPWEQLDGSPDFIPTFTERPIEPGFVFKFYLASGRSEEVCLFDADGRPSRAACEIVREWATQILERGEQLVGPDLPEVEAIDLARAPLALYKVLRPRFGRRQGLTPAAIHATAEANGDDFFLVTAAISRAKSELNEALKPFGFVVSYLPTRGGYFLERVQ